MSPRKWHFRSCFLCWKASSDRLPTVIKEGDRDAFGDKG